MHCGISHYTCSPRKARKFGECVLACTESETSEQKRLSPKAHTWTITTSLAYVARAAWEKHMENSLTSLGNLKRNACFFGDPDYREIKFGRLRILIAPHP